MKFRQIFLVLAVGLATAACSDIERSRNLADPNISAATLAQQVCSLCHGIGGRSTNPNFPSLAAQQPAYFVAQMKEFRSHNRFDPAGIEYMWGLSRSLTDEQIQGLAIYYSTSVSASPGKTGSREGIERGRLIFEKGVSEKNIPACSACHGAQAQGNEKFPRLAHQHAGYIVKQLKVFQRTDQRQEGGMMRPVAHDLTAANMRDVAAFLQAFAVE